MALQEGIRIHHCLVDWLVRARSHQTSTPAYTDTSSFLSGPRLASKHGKIRTGPHTSFLPRKLPVRPERGQSQTTLDWWQTTKVRELLTDRPVGSGNLCPS